MTCRSGKLRFAKRGGAHRRAKAIARMHKYETRGDRRGAEAEAYLCADCGGWHVATREDTRRGRRAA